MKEMTMKILLTDVTAEPGPDTLVAFHGGPHGDLTTLRGDYVPEAFIAQAGRRDVEDAVDKTITGPKEQGEDPNGAIGELLHDLSSTAGSLLGYEDGSPVRVSNEDRSVPSIDLSDASEVDLVPDLAVGDPVVITGPPDRDLLNARGRVGSIAGRRVLVDLDPGDLGRLERSRGLEMTSGSVCVPRRWLEHAEPRRFRRRVGRGPWRLLRLGQGRWHRLP
jgi:hypothetical protein